MGDQLRSIRFKHRTQGRYWWFQNHDYVPAAFSLLTDEEWEVMDQWYTETDARGSAGEANIPPINLLIGMIEGSGVPNIVQLGHYEGFSTLLLGFTMRRMGFKHSVFTVDISKFCSEYTSHWVRKAGLSEYVSVETASSEDASLPGAAAKYFESEIGAIFIDSSHQYSHTLDELEVWFSSLRPFGLIFMHDVSAAAVDFDSTRNGGVIRAVTEWTSGRSDAAHILLNQDVVYGKNPPHLHQLVYQDACGFGIIQKRHPLRP
jgi:predicted O-methyltransferase YrrM